MLKKLILFTLIALLGSYGDAKEPITGEVVKGSFVMVFSDTHLSPQDLDPKRIPSGANAKLNHAAFHGGMDAMISEANKAVARGATSVTIVFNGDPFDRPDLAGKTPAEVKKIIGDFADFVKKTISRGVKPGTVLDFIANIGDHECPKIYDKNFTDIPKNVYVIEDRATGKRSLHTRTKDSPIPKTHKKVISLRGHYRELASEGHVVYNPGKSTDPKKMVWKYVDGNDLLRVEEYSPAIAEAYREKGFRLPDLPDKPPPGLAIPAHDPRIMQLPMTLKDGQLIQVAHVDSLTASDAELKFEIQRQIAQGHIKLDGVELTPEGKLPRDPDTGKVTVGKEGANFNAGSAHDFRPGGPGSKDPRVTTITSDAHNPRRNLKSIITNPTQAAMLTGGELVNSGTFSAVTSRNENSLTSFAVIDETGNVRIIGIDASGQCCDERIAINASIEDVNKVRKQSGDLKKAKAKLADLQKEISDRKPPHNVSTPEEGRKIKALEADIEVKQLTLDKTVDDYAKRLRAGQTVDTEPGRYFSGDVVDELEEAARVSNRKALESLRDQGFVPRDPEAHIRQLAPCL
jgi:hypothetical protein